jgi:hypothetical protein
MVKLVGPEVLRLPITADVQDMRMSVRAWALQFMEGASALLVLFVYMYGY